MSLNNDWMYDEEIYLERFPAATWGDEGYLSDQEYELWRAEQD